MSSKKPSRRRFGLPFRQDSYDAEVRDELDFHIEMRTQKLISQGLSPDEAAREARRRFGDPRQVRSHLIREGRRDALRSGLAENFSDAVRDLRWAVRSLLRTPGLTAASLLILAIGIGATTAFFAVVHAVVWEPMPYASPERVVGIEVRSSDGPPSGILSPGVLLHWQDGVPGVEAIAPTAGVTAALTTEGAPIRVLGTAAAHDFWRVIGVDAALGRTFSEADDRPGAPPVLVLSDRLWRTAFAASPAVLGQDVDIDGVTTTIIGVMPAELDVLDDEVQFWRPLRLDPDQRSNLGSRYLSGIALLAPGTSPAQAEVGLDAVLSELGLRAEDGSEFHTVLEAPEEALSRSFRPALFVSLAAMGLVLLVGCGNVATLLLARGASRERETSIRVALGAGRARILRSLLTEGAVLVGASTLLGLALARWGIALLKAGTPFPVPRLSTAELDGSVVLFTAALALVTAAIFGIAPALRAARVDLRAALGGGEGATSRDPQNADRIRSAFLTLQAAVSLVLIVAATLLVRSSIQLASVENGYRAEGVMTGMVALPFARYPDHEGVLTRYAEIEAALRRIPGVRTAAIGSRLPLTGAGAGYGFRLVGDETSESVPVRLRIVGEDYWETLGIPLTTGRALRRSDDESAAPAVVVNEAFVRRFGLDPRGAIGRTVVAPEGTIFADASGSPIEWQIVGVSADARDLGPRGGARPELFFSLRQAPVDPWNWLGRQMVIALRTDLDPTEVVSPMREAVRSTDPSLPVYDVRPMSERLAGALARERFVAMVVSTLGALALVLAATGIFGAVAYQVSRRTREIGVRVALGAARAGVRGWIVRQSLRPIVLGVVLGLPAALFAGQPLEDLLFGTRASDLGTTLGAALALVGVAAMAAWIPASRATAIDPVEALRAD